MKESCTYRFYYISFIVYKDMLWCDFFTPKCMKIINYQLYLKCRTT